MFNVIGVWQKYAPTAKRNISNYAISRPIQAAVLDSYAVCSHTLDDIVCHRAANKHYRPLARSHSLCRHRIHVHHIVLSRAQSETGM